MRTVLINRVLAILCLWGVYSNLGFLTRFAWCRYCNEDVLEPISINFKMLIDGI